MLVDDRVPSAKRWPRTDRGRDRGVWDTIDLTVPKTRGAEKKIRAPGTARSVRVRYRVTATDDVDGAVPVRCKPSSGSRFKVGARTGVRCAASDLSANTAHATFRVTVRRR
jgi:hypothetical protein